MIVTKCSLLVLCMVNWWAKNRPVGWNGLRLFLPTVQFLAPKLIILIKCLIDIFFLQSVVLMFLYVEQDVNLG